MDAREKAAACPFVIQTKEDQTHASEVISCDHFRHDAYAQPFADHLAAGFEVCHLQLDVGWAQDSRPDILEKLLERVSWKIPEQIEIKGLLRSEERRVGKEVVSTGRSRG